MSIARYGLTRKGYGSRFSHVATATKEAQEAQLRAVRHKPLMEELRVDQSQLDTLLRLVFQDIMAQHDLQRFMRCYYGVGKHPCVSDSQLDRTLACNGATRGRLRNKISDLVRMKRLQLYGLIPESPRPN